MDYCVRVIVYLIGLFNLRSKIKGIIVTKEYMANAIKQAKSEKFFHFLSL